MGRSIMTSAVRGGRGLSFTDMGTGFLPMRVRTFCCKNLLRFFKNFGVSARTRGKAVRIFFGQEGRVGQFFAISMDGPNGILLNI